MTTTGQKYNVGGVMLDRPFKIRRLGHFGFNGLDMEAKHWHFYIDLLGFRISAPAMNGGFFGRHNSDHHSFVIFNRESIDERLKSNPMSAKHYRDENDINQITWQVQNVDEVWQATRYFKDLELDVRTEGRAPAGVGSNFHLYVWDPDEQINELFTGMEQIGWDGKTKPPEMGHGYREAQMEAVPSEYDEVQGDIESGMDIYSGYRYIDPNERKYPVDGLLLSRPFKIVKVGPVNVFVDNVEATREYYEDVMGLQLHRGSELERREVRLPALRHGAPLDGPLPPRLAREAGSEREDLQHVLRRPGGQLPPAQGRGQLPARERCSGRDRHHPAGAAPGHRLRGLRLRPGRPLHHAVQLDGADRLGGPPATRGAAPEGRPEQLARDGRGAPR